jgi:flagellar motor switch protein FliM
MRHVEAAMPETLDQTEIKALLDAVEAGDVDTEPEPPKSTAPTISAYDFKRPERVGKDQIRALERLHEVFSRNVSAALSNHLRTVIDCRLTDTEQATYQEFTNSVANPTCFNVIHAKELEGELILDIEPTLVFTMFDKLTGGGGTKFQPPERAMTDLEWMVMKPTLERILAQLSNAWEGLFPLKMRYTSNETNPQLAQNIAPNEPVVLVSFSVTIGDDTKGTMTLCLPHNTMEPVLSRMAGYWFGNKVHRTETTQRDMLRQINDASVSLTCALNPAFMTLPELCDLEVGDVIRLDHPVRDAVTIEMDGQPAFAGQVGVMGKRNQVCVRITDNLAAERLKRLAR